METEVRTVSSTGGMKGVKAQRFSLIPVFPLTKLAELYDKGEKKYDTHNWRKGYGWDKSFDSLWRHATLFWEGEDYDVCPWDGENFTNVGCILTHPETGERVDVMTEVGRTCYNHTGSHHLDCVAFHAFALREFVETHPEFDNRYLGRYDAD